MKLKSIVLLGAVFFTLTACSQKKEEIIITQNPDITANNIVEKLQQQVKHYPNELMHNISYEQNYCFFEVLVNDIPVFKKFNGSPYGYSAFDANQAIFKSGTQKVMFRMYPVGNVEKENKTYTSFIEDTYLNLIPETYDKTIKGSFVTSIKKYKTPAIPNPVQGGYPDSIFIATGKDYYEGSFTFEAEVPYQLKGFEKAQDLRKMDTKELETKLLKKYQDIWSIFQNKEYDNIARISFDKLKNDVISRYYTKQEVKELWETGFSAFSNPTFKMQPLENYELKFFAEGKLVAFILKTEDLRLKGSTALWGKYKEEGTTRAFAPKVFFYIPESEKDFKVY